jgi:predicted RNase H-like HicB family nuclease
MNDYPFVVLPETDQGGFYVVFPDLPGCMSDGETIAEAVENARDAFDAWMAVQHERGMPIPAPQSAAQARSAQERERYDSLMAIIHKLSEMHQDAEGRVAELEVVLAKAVRRFGEGEFEANLPLLALAQKSGAMERH